MALSRRVVLQGNNATIAGNVVALFIEAEGDKVIKRKVLLWIGGIGVVCPLPWLLAIALWLDVIFNTKPLFVVSFLLVYIIGLCCVFVGCYLWVREKHRPWPFVLWGLLAPVGYFGIALLKDKSHINLVGIAGDVI